MSSTSELGTGLKEQLSESVGDLAYESGSESESKFICNVEVRSEATLKVKLKAKLKVNLAVKLEMKLEVSKMRIRISVVTQPESWAKPHKKWYICETLNKQGRATMPNNNGQGGSCRSPVALSGVANAVSLSSVKDRMIWRVQ
jgi:hypothetical protein